MGNRSSSLQTVGWYESSMPSVDLCCTPSLYEMKTHLVFNNQHVFVSKAANRHFNVYFKGYNNSRGNSLEACFTPDSMFVMIGELKQKPNVRITYIYLLLNALFSDCCPWKRILCLVCQARRTGGSTCGAPTVGWRWPCWMGNKDPSTHCSSIPDSWRLPAPAAPWWADQTSAGLWTHGWKENEWKSVFFLIYLFFLQTFWLPCVEDS